MVDESRDSTSRLRVKEWGVGYANGLGEIRKSFMKGLVRVVRTTSSLENCRWKCRRRDYPEGRWSE